MVINQRKTTDAGVTESMRDPFTSMRLNQINGKNDKIIDGKRGSAFARRTNGKVLSTAGVLGVKGTKNQSTAFAK
jgi:hypothetical protein